MSDHAALWEVEAAYSREYQATTWEYKSESEARTAFAHKALNVGWGELYAWVQLRYDGVEQALVTCENDESGYHPIPHPSA